MRPIATALVVGNDPEARLAEAAVEAALDKSGLAHAQGVLLFLTPEFARHAQTAVTAAARQAQCMQVTGGIASGVFTESGWALDRPAAAAMVIGGPLAFGHADAPGTPTLSYAGSMLPPLWRVSEQRFGGVFGSAFALRSADANAAAWQLARLCGESGACAQLHGAQLDLGISRGWQACGTTATVDSSRGFDLCSIDGRSAAEHLAEALPPPFRYDPARHLHQLVALISDAVPDAPQRAATPLALATDGALTLSERVSPGQQIAWAIRTPETAEADMRATALALAQRQSARGTPPAGALLFSCIGRSPFFYGGEDRDLRAFTDTFPGLPVIGVYGTGQIAPLSTVSGGNAIFQNAVVTALITPSRQTPDV